jgi:hypothetical protein
MILLCHADFMLPFCRRADRNADGLESSTRYLTDNSHKCSIAGRPPRKSSRKQVFVIECDETRVATLAQSESILPGYQYILPVHTYVENSQLLQLVPKTWSCSCRNGWHPLATVLATENAHQRNHYNDDEQTTRQPRTPHLVDSSPPLSICMVVGRLRQCTVAVAVIRGGNCRVIAIRRCCWQLLWCSGGGGGGGSSHCIHGLVVYQCSAAAFRVAQVACCFPWLFPFGVLSHLVKVRIVQSSVFPKLLIHE